MMESEYLTQGIIVQCKLRLSLEADVVPLVDIIRQGHLLPGLGQIRDHCAGSLRLHGLWVVEAGVGQRDSTALRSSGHQLLPALVSSGDHLLSKLFVFRFTVEGELISGLPVRHLVDLEPLNCSLERRQLNLDRDHYY